MSDTSKFVVQVTPHNALCFRERTAGEQDQPYFQYNLRTIKNEPSESTSARIERWVNHWLAILTGSEGHKWQGQVIDGE